MKSKNIAILVKHLLRGGAEKQAVLLAEVLDKDYIVHFIIFNKNEIDKEYLRFFHENKSIRLHFLNGNKLSKLYSLYKCLKKNSIEVLFSYLTAANFYAAVIGRLAKVSRIYSGIRSIEFPFLKKEMEKFVTNHVSSVTISNCYSGRDIFIRQGFKKEKMIVIPNCYKDILPPQERSEREVVRIISVGRFVFEKDYHTALKSISLLRNKNSNIIYQIVGYGKLESDIRKWISELDLENFVEIYINPDNIGDLLNKADIYLSTSIIEGTSNSIMEAMNASLPIVATDVGDNHQLIEDNKNGYLVNPGDVNLITDKLFLLSSDYPLRLKMGKAGNSLLEKNFSQEIFKKRYQDIIENQLETNI